MQGNDPKSDMEELVSRDMEDACEAERYARLQEEIFVDADLLDAESCPPDRRFFLADKEAWIYEHGNICELVFVRPGQ